MLTRCRATSACMLALALVACNSTGPNGSSVWGSNEVSLTVADNKTTVQLLASGGCYGSYGEVDRPIAGGTFALTGTFTQLTGVFPGSVQYPAQFAGSVAGNRLTMTITIAALQQVLGPFSLTQGVNRSWPACLYP